MVSRTVLLLALALLVSACSSVQAQTMTDATLPLGGESNPRALAAAEQGELGKPTIVFFHAQWCNVCRRARPVIDALAQEHADSLAVVRMDIDDHEAEGAVDRYRVNATPTFILFSADGNVLASIPGWPGREVMESAIRQMLGTN